MLKIQLEVKRFYTGYLPQRKNNKKKLKIFKKTVGFFTLLYYNVSV